MIKISNLSVKFGSKFALKDINLQIHKGEIINILGSNGSGKTTLLRCILDLEKFSGSVEIDGTNTANLSPKQMANLLSFVPQSHNIPYDFSVFDIVLMSRFASSFYKYSEFDRQKALEALEKTGISHLKDEVFRKLSGGQKQLVLVARAIASNAKIILLDEPINGLDLSNQILLLDLLRDLANDGYTVLCTTHYPEHALKIADKIAWLDKGNLIKFDTPKSVITKEQISQIYGLNSEFIKDSSENEHLIILGRNL